jgi:hypothetical protein
MAAGILIEVEASEAISKDCSRLAAAELVLVPRERDLCKGEMG